MFWNIIEKSYSQMEENKHLVFKLFYVPVLIKFIISAVILFIMYGHDNSSQIQLRDAKIDTLLKFSVWLIIFLLNVFVYSWVFVAWHQCSKQNREMDGYFAVVKSKHVVSYFKKLTTISVLSYAPLIAFSVLALILIVTLKEVFFFIIAPFYGLIQLASWLIAPYFFKVMSSSSHNCNWWDDGCQRVLG